MHPTWKLQAYDYSGNVIGTIFRMPQQAIVFEGTSDAFALVLPDLRTTAAFFTDPDAIGRAAHDAFFASATCSCTPHDWNRSSPRTKALWIAAGQAAITAPTTSSASAPEKNHENQTRSLSASDDAFC